MEIDVVDHPVMPFDRHRVLADEKMLVPLETDHHVARGEAHQPLIGLDPGNDRIEMRPRPRIPTRPERRVQRQAMMADLDLGDFHPDARLTDAISSRYCAPRPTPFPRRFSHFAMRWRHLSLALADG